MRLTSLMSLYSVCLVILVASIAALTMWSTAQSRIWQERINLAESSYHAHRSLQSHIYQLFKQHGDALLIGDRDRGAMEEALRGRIAADIETIRTVIGQEIQTVGEEEIEELELLAQVEKQVEDITRTLGSLTADGQPVDADARRAQLIDVLDREVDIRLASLIEEALAEEREEVDETFATAAASRARTQAATAVLGLSALGLIALGFALFRRDVMHPLSAILDAARAMDQGDLTAQPLPTGNRDLKALAEVLVSMAERIDEREQRDRAAQADLQAQVGDRTRELEFLLTRIETSEANRRQLLADISHELRTPLTIVQGEAEINLRTIADLPGETATGLKRIRDASRHANSMVDDLLLIARKEAGKLHLDRQDTDLVSIVRASAHLFRGEVTVDAPGRPLIVRADAMRLRQCMLSAFGNAARHGGSEIRVGFQTANGRHHIFIDDNGPGMTDLEKAAAFDRFYRGSNAQDHAHEGTGIGLPIVKAIVEAHGGSVELADATGGGLRLDISLPAQVRLRMAVNNDV